MVPTAGFRARRTPVSLTRHLATPPQRLSTRRPMMRTYADGLPTLTMGLANFAPAPQPRDDLLDRARLADEPGVDRTLVVDHVVTGENIAAYDGGRFPPGPDGQWLEPMTTMAVIAGM